MSEQLLTGESLRKAFARTMALDNATVAVDRGEIVAVTGPSGSGKSTLMLCLAGVLRPESGRVTYSGVRLDELGEADRARLRRREFGLVLQFGQLLSELTVTENVALPLLLGGHPHLRLIPTSVTPTWWQILSICVVVVALVGWLGWRAARPAAIVPLPTVRQVPESAPRPWGIVPVVVALVGFGITFGLQVDSTALLLVVVALAAVGLMLLGPPMAFGAGRYVAQRATSATALLGSRRLMSDPRAAGRASAPIAVVGLVMGGVGLVFAMLIIGGTLEPFYLVSVVLVVVLVFLALVLVAFALAVHGVESLATHRRQTAALAAAGVPAAVVERSLIAEALIVALPAATVGVVLGSLPLLCFAALQNYEAGFVPLGAFLTAAALAVTWAVVALAVVVAVQLVRPWLRQAMDPENLRTA